MSANRNSLQRRIDRLITQVDKQLSQPNVRAIVFDFSLFPEPEQTQLRNYLAALPDPLILSDLTDQQLHIISCWANLAITLAEGNEQEAARQREMINTPDEELLQAFLNLDLSALPHHDAPGLKEQIGNRIYSYTRAWYRSIVMSVKHQGVERYRDDLWRWVRFLNDAA
jgi:hypothetical protein